MQRVDGARAILSELSELVRLASTQDDLDSITPDLDAAVELMAAIETDALFAGDADERPAVCHLRAGQGGTEACDWVAILLRMYVRWASAEGLRLEVVSATNGTEAGYSEAAFVVQGQCAYGWLRSEHGVHRLARASPHDKDERVHTSFAAVEVVPLVTGPDMAAPLPKGEMRLDIYRGSGPGGQHRNTRDTAVRATHLPTGVVASCGRERSQHRNKERAIALLTSRVRALERDQERQKAASQRAGQLPASFGSQVRSYTLSPRSLVVDHRTGHKSTEADAVLDGGLRPLMERWLLSPCARPQDAR